jgi:hypothetical protein
MLVPLSGTDCLVAGGRLGVPFQSAGPHLLYVTLGNRVAVRAIQLDTPWLATQPVLRLWSGGIPPNTAAWLDICTRPRSPLDPGKSLRLATGGRIFDLRPPEISKCGGGDSALAGYSFSSVIAKGGDARTGYLFVHDEENAEIYPVVRTGRGWFLMKETTALAVFMAGILVQVLYWLGAKWMRFRIWRAKRPSLPRRRRTRFLHGLITACRSGAIALFVVEIGIVLLQTDRSGTWSHLGPTAAIGAGLYVVKLAAGFILPEFITDEAFSYSGTETSA